MSLHAFITASWILHVTLLAHTGPAVAATSNDGKYDHLIQFPLLSAQQLDLRRLQETPEEEEGHPQMVDALYQGYGEHYVDLWCGSPPQRQTVILDTGGMGGTAFPCSRCADDCGLDYQTDAYFDESKSLNFHELTCDECDLGSCEQSAISKCEFGVGYEDPSTWWFAIESRDHCYIGGVHDKPVSIDDCTRSDCDDLDPEHAPGLAFDLTFGCQTRVGGIFRTRLADGVMGLNKSPQSFWHQMYDAGKIADRLFSLCYTRKDTVLRNGTDAGAMTLGGSDDRLHLSPMVFTKQEDVFGANFGVLLRKMHIRQGGGGDSVNATRPNLNVTTLNASETLNHGYFVIESGTTSTYLTSQLAMTFAEIWEELTGSEYGHSPKSFTYEQVQELPTILYQFQGSEELNSEVGDPKDVVNLAGDLDPENPYDVVVAMPPNHYMWHNELTGDYTSRLYFTQPLSTQNILGANTLMGHDVLFDVENMRIGWAESRCDYRHLVEKAGFDIDGDDQPDVPNPPSPDDPIPNVPTPAAPTPDKPNYEPVLPTADENSVVAPTSGYSPTSQSGEDGGGMCSSFGCRSLWFLIIFVAVPLVVVRQGRFGVWTERVRQLTGGSDYRTMLNSYEGGDSGQHELELQVKEPGAQVL